MTREYGERGTHWHRCQECGLEVFGKLDAARLVIVPKLPQTVPAERPESPEGFVPFRCAIHDQGVA